MLSDIKPDFPTANKVVNNVSEAYVTLKGNHSNVTCRFNADASLPEQGRPSTVWKVRKVFTKTQMNILDPDELRNEIAARLGQSTANIKRGNYTISKAPYYWVDAKIKGTPGTGNGGVGQRIQLQPFSGGSAFNISPYGFRAGMLVHKMTAGYASIAQANSKDVYGYCFHMEAANSLDVDLTESATFSADDLVRLFIPIRAGDIVHVDNVVGDVNGSHVITEITYSEMPAPTSQIQSIGQNEVKVGSIQKRTIWQNVTGAAADAVETAAPHQNPPKSTQLASFDGTFSYPANNRIEWTAGTLQTSDQTAYQIVASGTGSTSGTSDATHGLGSNGMVGTNKYVVYVDPEGENPDTNAYHIKTILIGSYAQDRDNIRLGSAMAGVNKPSFWFDGNLVSDGTPGLVEGDTIIHNETMTTALLKKGARAWTTDLEIKGTAFNAITWDNGTADTNATLTFANGDTVTINTGAATGIAAGTHYLYLNGVTGAIAPSLTTTHGTAIGDAKILLATVTVTSATDGDKPTIFPFTGKKPTLSAVVLAADLIIADHIRTRTITADRMVTQTLTANEIAANTITANEIAANTIGTNRLTVAARTEISEKTKTHVGTSAPSGPRLNDIWFDTGPDPVVIKVYDGSSWVIRNQNSEEVEPGNKITQITGAGTTPTSSTGSPQTLGDRVINITDFLEWSWDTNISGSNKWRGVIVADAINNATTTIDGGFINTQKIVLNDGGASNTIFATGGVTGTANPPPTNPGARIEMDYTGLYGYSSSGTSNKQFYLLSSNGKAYFGAGAVVADSSGLTITNNATDGNFSTSSLMQFKVGGNLKGYIRPFTSPDNMLAIGTIDDGTLRLGSPPGGGGGNSNSPNTESIQLHAQYIGIQCGATGLKYYSFPSSGPSVNEVLACSIVTTGQTISGESSQTIYTLDWVAGGTTYTAGTGLTLSGTTFNVDSHNHSGVYADASHGGHGGEANQNAFGVIGADVGESLINAGSESAQFNVMGGTDIDVETSGNTLTVSYTGSGGGGHTHSSSLDVAADDITCSAITMSGTLHSTSTAVRFSNLNQYTQTYDIKMDGSGYLYKYPSSERFKENIIDLDFDSSKIYDLLPRTFKWKDAEQAGIPVVGQIDFGYIAEEVHEILPQLVGYDNFEDGDNLPASVHYNQITVLLVEEMKKLRARIEVLEGN